MGLEATGYGIVLGSLGFGAVGGALLLPRLRRSLPVDRLTAAATLVFAGATLALAYLRFMPLLVACMMAGGMAWLVMMSSLTVAAQTASPAWVRARALGIYLLVFQGLMAVGSFGWGALAEQVGNGTAHSVAALALVGGLAATWRWPLHMVQRLDLSPSSAGRAPYAGISFATWPIPTVTWKPSSSSRGPSTCASMAASPWQIRRPRPAPSHSSRRVSSQSLLT